MRDLKERARDVEELTLTHVGLIGSEEQDRFTNQQVPEIVEVDTTAHDYDMHQVILGHPERRS